MSSERLISQEGPKKHLRLERDGLAVRIFGALASAGTFLKDAEGREMSDTFHGFNIIQTSFGPVLTAWLGASMYVLKYNASNSYFYVASIEAGHEMREVNGMLVTGYGMEIEYEPREVCRAADVVIPNEFDFDLSEPKIVESKTRVVRTVEGEQQIHSFLLNLKPKSLITFTLSGKEFGPMFFSGYENVYNDRGEIVDEIFEFSFSDRKTPSTRLPYEAQGAAKIKNRGGSTISRKVIGSITQMSHVELVGEN